MLHVDRTNASCQAQQHGPLVVQPSAFAGSFSELSALTARADMVKILAIEDGVPSLLQDPPLQ